MDFLKSKQGLKRIVRDNKGSAIVMVIIALAFIAILGVTIMWMSLSNYRMKSTDQRNKQGFYTAETVFEQIKAGLQKDASEAANLAYSYVMQNYDSLNTEQKRESEFRLQFKRGLIKIISEDPSGSSTKYTINHLNNFIDAGLNISINVSDEGNGNYLGVRDGASFSDKGDIEGHAAGPGGEETGYVILKDIILEFTDTEGFYSEINTDIMISAPTTSFIDSTSLPPIFKYAMIADEGIDVGDGSLAVEEGGIYAGSGGIKVGSGKNLRIKTTDKNNSYNTISKGPINVGFGGNLNISKDRDPSMPKDDVLFASDINVDQADVTIDADTRVADDIAITGNGSDVDLLGKYCGFGNDSFNNGESSAVIINGLNTAVNLDGLDKLVLAGRSFIATQSARSQVNGVDPGEPEVSGNKIHIYSENPNYDVKMGESIAVKGNQLAYLVPSECIAVGSKTVKGKNPMTWTELAAFTREKESNPLSNMEIVDYRGTRITWLDNHTLDYFMPGSSANYIQKVFAPSNGEILCYFYVVLDENKQIVNALTGQSVDAASQYAQWYYEEESHKNKMDRYMYAYAPTVTLPTDDKIWAAAALVSSGGAAGTQSHKLAQALTGDEKSECDAYRTSYKGYCWDLTGNAIDATREATLSVNNLVFENALQVSSNSIDTNLEDFLADVEVLGRGGGRSHTSEFVVPTGMANEGKKAIVTDSSTSVSVWVVGDDGTLTNESRSVYVYDDASDDVRVLISTHDVLLKSNFNGIIITNGKIYNSGGVKVNGIGDDLDLKEEVMSVLSAKFDDTKPGSKDDPSSWRPIDFFKGGADYMGTSDAGSGYGSVDINSCVNYRNWIKN